MTPPAAHPQPSAAVVPRRRGPFARWPRVADAVLAIAVAAFAVLLQEGPGDTMIARELAEVPVPVLVVFVLASLAVYWRRSHPLPVIAVGLLSMLVLLPSGYADTGATVAIGLYSAGRYSDRDGWAQLAVVAAAVLLAVDGARTDQPWGEVAFGVAFLAGAWLLGRSRRLRDERADHYLREQEAERRQVVAEERTRIARELHDVVAHRVSLMTIQASAAVAVAGHDPPAARRAMEAVEDAGRLALEELRDLLGVLRPDLDAGERGPQPTLADIHRIAARVMAAGPTVGLRLPDDLPALPGTIELSAFRILQEALTNVLKHAGEDAHVEAEVRIEDGRLLLDVHDDGGSQQPTPAAGPPGGGHGIVGMRERATLLGGSLTAGPATPAGFRVHAALPLRRPDLDTAQE